MLHQEIVNVQGVYVPLVPMEFCLQMALLVQCWQAELSVESHRLQLHIQILFIKH